MKYAKQMIRRRAYEFNTEDTWYLSEIPEIFVSRNVLIGRGEREREEKEECAALAKVINDTCTLFQ